MNKITEQDLANRGVKGLPDVPGLTTEEMQRKLEEIAREILIPKVNELVEGLNNANSNLDYRDITDQITINNDKISCGAYTENGIVVVRVEISSGYNGSQKVIQINNQLYKPRITVNGIYASISTSSDKNKFCGAYINSSGEMYVWFDSELLGKENIIFVYPKRYGN